MNRLESAVRAVMIARNLANLSDVATKIGLQKSNLSKILSGQLGVSPTNLRKLVLRISPEPAQQFAILSAHLYDEVERSGFPLNLLNIEFQGEASAPVTFADLPIVLQQQLRLLADEIKNGDEGLSGALRWITGTVEDRRSAYPASKEKLPFVAEPDAHTQDLTREAIEAAKDSASKARSSAI